MKTTDELLFDIMAGLNERESCKEDAIKKKFMVLSTPRSGSSMFCDVLSNSGEIGECKEWFNFRYLQAYAKLFEVQNIDFGDYVRFVMRKTTGASGVFAVNMHVEQFVQLKQNNLNPFSLGFDVIVNVSRRNKIQQAISLVKAAASDQWSSETKPKEPAAEISHAAIAQALHHILESERIYNAELKHLVSQEFEYEEFQNLESTGSFSQVLGLLGKSWNDTTRTTLERQANEESADLAATFLAYIADK